MLCHAMGLRWCWPLFRSAPKEVHWYQVDTKWLY